MPYCLGLLLPFPNQVPYVVGLIFFLEINLYQGEEKRFNGRRGMGIFISPEKPTFIPTFCKRINRTSTAIEIWVTAFEERKTNDL